MNGVYNVMKSKEMHNLIDNIDFRQPKSMSITQRIREKMFSVQSDRRRSACLSRSETEPIRERRRVEKRVFGSEWFQSDKQ